MYFAGFISWKRQSCRFACAASDGKRQECRFYGLGLNIQRPTNNNLLRLTNNFQPHSSAQRPAKLATADRRIFSLTLKIKLLVFINANGEGL